MEALAEIQVEEVKTISAEQKSQAAAIFHALDKAGDNNGMVDAGELKELDKNGKLFKKMTRAQGNFITVEAFQEYFETMAQERGDKAAEGLLAHMQRFVAKLS